MSFNSLLDQKVGEVKQPPIFPAGTVRLAITGREFGKSSQKKTDFVKFKFKVLEPGADIEPEQLVDVNWANKTFDADFYLTEDALKMLENFLKAAGVAEGLSLSEGIESTIDGAHEVVGTVVHEMFTRKDGTSGTSAKLGRDWAAV